MEPKDCKISSLALRNVGVEQLKLMIIYTESSQWSQKIAICHLQPVEITDGDDEYLHGKQSVKQDVNSKLWKRWDLNE